MAVRFHWQSSDDRQDFVHRAVQSLVEGKLVVFPTETVYGLAAYALDSAAVERLVQAKGRGDQKPLTLALSSPDQAYEYVPAISVIGRRLVERCWPGPVTMVFPAVNGSTGVERLPRDVCQRISPDDSIGLRVPDHSAIRETLRLLPGPVVLTSANVSGQADPLDADSALVALGDAVELVLDDGPTRFGKPSTVVRIVADQFEVLREGVVPRSRLLRLASEVITFVCTGNSCRSPMAEAIFKRMLAEALACDVFELPERGYTILSAGVEAFDGAPASQNARVAVCDYNADLEDHVSQYLTTEIVRVSDRLIVMTREHKSAIEELWPELGPRPALLCPDRDVSDPIGGPIERYRECAALIVRQLRELLHDVIAQRTGRASTSTTSG